MKTDTERNADTSLALASSVCEALITQGVREFCVCPGRRNAPFVVLLEAAAKRFPQLRVHSFFDERSAGFFAIGRCRELRASGKAAPVAVCTTSGTACAELLPAAVEAWYSGDALVLVTSDRPKRLRGSGAPQAIEQEFLYGPYVASRFDIEEKEEIPDSFSFTNAPCHLNICFDEPVLPATFSESKAIDDWLRSNPALPVSVERLVGQEPQVLFNPLSGEALQGAHERLARFLRGSRSPLVIVGPLSLPDRAAVEEFLLRLRAPVFAEAGSQLQSSSRISHLMLRAGNSSVARLMARDQIDAVLRIGGVPAPRVWRDLDEKYRHIPVCVVADRPFVGMGRGEMVVASVGECLRSFAPSLAARDEGALELLLARDREQAQGIDALLSRYPQSEPGLLRQLDRRIPSDALIYLGNSLPVREWDLARQLDPPPRAFSVSRGANGIDGQLSTFLGLCAGEDSPAERRDERERWAILGDLTALYDLSAPWALRLVTAAPIRIVVIHNGGGQIFSRMFKSPSFLNQHDTSFAGWAQMWGMSFETWSGKGEFSRDTSRLVVEARPDPEATAAFWNEFESFGR